MGTCLSKKTNATNASSPKSLPKEPQQPKSEPDSDKNKVAEESNVVKKEVFIIKHRNSHERSATKSEEERSDSKKAQEKDIEIVKAPLSNGSENPNFNGLTTTPSAPVRTSSCTKEEVDAILIQCGRLSRSSSTGKANAFSSDGGGGGGGSRKYSGSKRSYDFDSENLTNGNGKEDDGVATERENRRRERSRSHSRRRTPSRERDSGGSLGNHQQRSGKSRERGNNSTGTARRVSRSPGRRSESPVPANSNGVATLNGGGNNMPGKMVSVPATDKSGSNVGGEGNTNAGVKRIQVKRNVGGNNDSRSGASPRARSPARVRVSGDKNMNTGSGQVLNTTLSRSNSRKAEQSPCRRNPLGEIDTNIIASQAPFQKPSLEHKIAHGAEYKINSNNLEHAINVISSGNESFKPNTITRSRSKRLSHDLDTMNPETLTANNPNTSYTALLLEDIQNFHQKNNTPPNFSLPACVTKACSILEAVADLNSSTGSNILEDRRRNPIAELQMSSNKNSEKPKIMMTKDAREPFIESEVAAKDELMEPSFQKYVTMKRGTMMSGEDLEEIESSGSNSYAGSQQHWLSSSSWEPNSAESTDNWMTSSRSISPLGFQRSAVLESGKNVDESGKKLAAVKKRDSVVEHQHNGIGRGRIGSRGSK